ncbi:MAG: hypothetical protein V4633_07885 [Pseudomonadota bacterium]
MTINQYNEAPEGGPGEQDPAAAAITPVGASRRRFAGAGILMTLASTPGMATNVCTTPSGSLSHGMATSHRPVVAPTCGGKSPGYYKNNPGGWPANPSYNSDVRFKDIFPVNTPFATLGNLKLLQVFQNNDNTVDPHNTGSHVLAAYLNILTNRSNVISEAVLKNIWREYQATGGGSVGYFVPSATVKWYGPDIVAYLIKTFHQYP